MLIKLRNAQQTAAIEGWFGNVTDVIFRLEPEKQVGNPPPPTHTHTHTYLF